MCKHARLHFVTTKKLFAFGRKFSVNTKHTSQTKTSNRRNRTRQQKTKREIETKFVQKYVLSTLAECS
jgi:hypothetical protein